MIVQRVQKNSSKNKIPKLRFPGFSEKWKEKKLGEVAIFLKGKGISKNDIVENGKNKCIRYGELYTEYKEIIDEVKSRTNISKNNTVLSEVNDLLIPSSGETPIDIATTSCIHQKGVFIGGDINILKLKNSCGDFFAYYLSNSKRRDIARLAQGHSVVHLYANHFKNLKINIPQKEEQEKIAGFLGGVDEWIENLKRQKEELEKYKKGIMQKIFSQEIRFKNDSGKDFPEWEEKRLGEVFYEPKKEKVKKPNNYELLTVKLHCRGIEKSGKFPNTTEKGRPYYIVNSGEFLIGKQNFHNGGFGISLFDNCITSNAIMHLKTEKDIDIYFIWYYMSQYNFYKRVELLIGGTGQKEISKKGFKKLKINLPSLSEQQKIANFLSAIDKKIEILDNKIKKMQEWKRGLMQGVFV